MRLFGAPHSLFSGPEGPPCILPPKPSIAQKPVGMSLPFCRQPNGTKSFYTSKPNHTSEFTMEALVSACFPEQQVKPSPGKGASPPAPEGCVGQERHASAPAAAAPGHHHILSPPSGPPSSPSSRCCQFSREQPHSTNGWAHGSFSSLPASDPGMEHSVPRRYFDKCLLS